MAEWVLAVERAYVAAATSRTPTAESEELGDDRAFAAIGAVASHFLAVGTPRSFGVVVDADTLAAGALSLEAHRTWFAPIDLRCAGGAIDGMRETSVAEALACDIVCVHVKMHFDGQHIRRGTHVNILVPRGLVSDELEKVADVTYERDLGRVAAGFIDGRQLDELTVFVAKDAAIARAALATAS